MWQLRGRDNKFKQWSEYGAFETIADAAKRILELEHLKPNFSLFLSVYVDTLGTLTNDDTSDATILSRLEYRGTDNFYLLERSVS